MSQRISVPNSSAIPSFESFEDWKNCCTKANISLYEGVIKYETAEKNIKEEEIWRKIKHTYDTMKDAIQTGLTENMQSRSLMVNNSGKKIYNHPKIVLNKAFQDLIAEAISAKEVNSCMGRIVAAPTAGASGILPAILHRLEETHSLDKEKIYEALVVASGIGLVINNRAFISGSMGGCQAETGSAAAMGAGAIVYALGGNIDQIFNAVAITIQCTLGLICDPVAGLVEVPCIVRNASAVSVAYSSAQIAICDVDPIIPADECVDVMKEVGKSMEARYKETAQGGLANTPTAQKISERVFGKKNN